MKEPIQPEMLKLNSEWKIVPYFTDWKESFGYLLCRVNWSVPVSYEAKPLLDALNGEHTLAHIHQQFGDEMLEFIGQLYRQGMLGFE